MRTEEEEHSVQCLPIVIRFKSRSGIGNMTIYPVFSMFVTFSNSWRISCDILRVVSSKACLENTKDNGHAWCWLSTGTISIACVPLAQELMIPTDGLCQHLLVSTTLAVRRCLWQWMTRKKDSVSNEKQLRMIISSWDRYSVFLRRIVCIVQFPNSVINRDSQKQATCLIENSDTAYYSQIMALWRLFLD
jgi:hypothetical protein